ncbi:ABC transporter permease [Trebonia kvetii]|uniref:Transport permease protein n=1 Tax=Trebonia kvetii TaxID=2480626 RepID=A0A6P2C3E0_9ACTN|nr:ABC transporter permease [Trebonia kvetii]TVZ05698.1 ABC transporter permease [Trebonia kvetii]
MDNSGQISAPGTLQAGAVIVPEPPRVPDRPLAELAADYELKLSGARPPLRRYVAMLWQRRHFIIGYATARNVSMYTDAKLGQIWQVLTPLLNAGVYYLIFGLLFEAARGVAHYPAFLVTGVFVFAFSERSIVTGSNVMRANLQLIRALYFPRASLPLAYVIVELQQMLVGMVVLVVIMLVSGEYPSWYWLLLIPAVFLQTLFNTGAALIVARLGGSLADVSELIPFFLRISRYFCGVMYLIITLPAVLTNWQKQVLSLNPFAVYISLVRVAFMHSYRTNSAGNQPYNYGLCQQFLKIPGPGKHILPGTRVPTTLILPNSKLPSIVIPKSGPLSKISNIPLQAYCHAIVTNNDLWIAAVGWGVVFFAFGIVFFWRAENLYGRG